MPISPPLAADGSSDCAWASAAKSAPAASFAAAASAGLLADRLPQLGERGGRLALGAVERRERQARARRFGIERARLLEGGLRAGQVVHALQHHAALLPERRVPGSQREPAIHGHAGL